ncbi:MAG: hypothetical protein IKV32_03735 [Muribaculaceae bacterium]|nr:hypothetical protein [Muribaculaceae bacterium]
MDKINALLENCRSIDEMLDKGDIEDAVRLSGELLAKADALWTVARNNNSTSQNEISALAILAAYHCDALAMMSNCNDAYATAVTALFQMAIDRSDSLSLNQSAMQLYITAIFALMQIIQQQFANADATDREHLNEIMRYLASMLYYYYNKVGKARPDFPHLHVAYQILSQLRNDVDIQTPTIKVVDEDVNPSAPLPLFADLVGRSHAMGLMND